MWKCPKCGKEFQKVNQSHFCGNAPKTIDEYMMLQSEELRPILSQIRTVISTAIPEAQERISWSMPTWWKKHNLIQFAVNKHHIGLYSGPEAVTFFGEQLSEYETNKGSIRLPLNKPMPYALIADIAKWCYEQEIRN